MPTQYVRGTSLHLKIAFKHAGEASNCVFAFHCGQRYAIQLVFISLEIGYQQLQMPLLKQMDVRHEENEELVTWRRTSYRMNR